MQMPLCSTGFRISLFLKFQSKVLFVFNQIKTTDASLPLKNIYLIEQVKRDALLSPNYFHLKVIVSFFISFLMGKVAYICSCTSPRL